MVTGFFEARSCLRQEVQELC